MYICIYSMYIITYLFYFKIFNKIVKKMLSNFFN